MEKPYPPFTCTSSPAVVKLLHELGCTLAISTYQANKLIFISSNGSNLVQLPRNFDKAMGVSYEDGRLAIATRSSLQIFAENKQLAFNYPKKPKTYDLIFMPRMTYYTGYVDLHDIELVGHEVYAVNTLFSCIVKMSDRYNWEPIWSPPNITKITSEDRCHLNGMIVRDGKPAYATAFNDGDALGSWRGVIPSGGILWDIEKNEKILEDLQMPHSPRWYDGKIYFLESAEGKVVCYDPVTKQKEVIFQLNAFARGLSKIGQYLFVGKSAIRSTSKVFKDLPIAQQKIQSGVAVIDMEAGECIGEINYLSSVEEIYDVEIIPNAVRPNILSSESDYHLNGLSIPGATFWARKEE